jgi:hypothetical protein
MAPRPIRRLPLVTAMLAAWRGARKLDGGRSRGDRDRRGPDCRAEGVPAALKSSIPGLRVTAGSKSRQKRFFGCLAVITPENC